MDEVVIGFRYSSLKQLTCCRQKEAEDVTKLFSRSEDFIFLINSVNRYL